MSDTTNSDASFNPALDANSDSSSNFDSLLASATSAAGGRFFRGTNNDRYFVDSNATVAQDNGSLSGDRTDAVMTYEFAAQQAGLSKDQIKQNIQKIESQTDQQAKSSDLSQNTYTLDDVNNWMHNSNNKDVTGYGKMSKTQHTQIANNDLQHLHDVLLSDKNAFKYDEAQRGLSEDQINNDLHAQQSGDDYNLSLGSANAAKLNQKYGLTDSTNASTPTQKSVKRSTALSTPDAVGQLNPHATFRTSKGGVNVPLYAKSITASKVIGKNGRPEFRFSLDAKSRADLDKSPFGGRYLNNSGKDADHGQSISKADLNKILEANGRQPLSDSQINAAIKSGRPLVNSADNIAFNANVTKGKDNSHYNIDTNSITKPSAKFNSKNERKLEHQKASRSKGLSKAAAKSNKKIVAKKATSKKTKSHTRAHAAHAEMSR